MNLLVPVGLVLIYLLYSLDRKVKAVLNIPKNVMDAVEKVKVNVPGDITAAIDLPSLQSSITEVAAAIDLPSLPSSITDADKRNAVLEKLRPSLPSSITEVTAAIDLPSLPSSITEVTAAIDLPSLPPSITDANKRKALLEKLNKGLPFGF